jgi:hypothetical protein
VLQGVLQLYRHLQGPAKDCKHPLLLVEVEVVAQHCLAPAASAAARHCLASQLLTCCARVAAHQLLNQARHHQLLLHRCFAQGQGQQHLQLHLVA